MHSGPQGKSGPCVQREPTERVIIVIVTLRGERREREEKEREKREPPPPFSPPPVCRFKTSPCVLAKRAHVFNMRAFCRYTRGRFEPAHGEEGGFRGPSRAPHRQHTLHTDNTHHTPQTTDHRHHTPHIAQPTPAPTPYITHIPHTLSAHTPHTHSQHTRTTISVHTHNTRHIHIHIHILTYTYTPHIPHHTHNAHKYHTKPTHTCTHHRQPTLILHSIKICNICNVCNGMRIYCFWN